MDSSPLPDFIRRSREKERLLNLRLLEEIEFDTFAEKQAELRSKETRLQTKLDGQGGQQSECNELAVNVFELSQALTSKWLAADIAEKRLLLEIICLNWTLDGVNLVPQTRRPFDVHWFPSVNSRSAQCAISSASSAAWLDSAASSAANKTANPAGKPSGAARKIAAHHPRCRSPPRKIWVMVRARGHDPGCAS
jgi:hypothetical protein